MVLMVLAWVLKRWDLEMGVGAVWRAMVCNLVTPLPPGASIGEVAEGEGFAGLMGFVTSRKFIVLCGFEKRWVVQRTGTDRAGEKPGLPPMVSSREHRRTNISIQLI